MTKTPTEEATAPLLAESDEEHGADDEPPVKKKRKSIIWQWIKDFDDKKDAQKAVEDEKCWSKTFKNFTKHGAKHFFRCTRGKK